MSDFFKKPLIASQNTRRKLRLAAGNGFGVVLFILVFLPFGVFELSLSDTFLYVAGFGLIEFISVALVLILIPRILPDRLVASEWEEGPPNLLNLAIWFISSAGFTFYIRYVGRTSFSTGLLVRITVICLVPSVVVILSYRIQTLTRRIEKLLSTGLRESPPEHTPHIPRPGEIEIRSENGSEIVTIKLDDLLYLKAADNYVEVISREDGDVRSRLIRTTLKRLAIDFSPYRQIQQCHRAYIVNSDNVKQLKNWRSGYRLYVEGVSETIPVSRAYYIKVKELLDKG